MNTALITGTNYNRIYNGMERDFQATQINQRK